MAFGAGVMACGGGGAADSDTLVLRFIGFNGIGITQADSATETSADVDVAPSVCSNETNVEPFTLTAINAVFVNEEKVNLVLDAYTVDLSEVADLGVRTNTLSVTVQGRRCGNNLSRSGGDIRRNPRNAVRVLRRRCAVGVRRLRGDP